MRGQWIKKRLCLSMPLAWPLLLTLALPLLNGCFVHTRIVKQEKMPTVVLTATADDLVKTINTRCNEIHSLSATVDFQIKEGGPKKGKESTINDFSGYILMRKPESLRVIALLPVVHTRAMDMASDGKTFKLSIPSRNKVYEGPNTVTKESSNALENFRPGIFADSLLIDCIDPDDLVTLTADTKRELDVKSKQMLVKPEYDLAVVRRKENSQELVTERVIHFNREDLQPFQEDIYDAKGAIQTTAIYGPMQTFGPQKFPGSITIKRPLEELQIMITFTKVTTNLNLTDDQFDFKIPENATVQHLE
jgi:outer membrane lipoprotein-sorting protein